jgi:hypothetical protein
LIAKDPAARGLIRRAMTSLITENLSSSSLLMVTKVILVSLLLPGQKG